MQAGCPFELDPYTLDTHPGPETLNGFLRSGIAPSTTGTEILDKAIGLGKACTAHPHVVHGEGTCDRLAIFSWQRCDAACFAVTTWSVHLCFQIGCAPCLQLTRCAVIQRHMLCAVELPAYGE